MNRIFPKESHPMSERATGQLYKTPGGVLERFEEAPSPRGTAHWYAKRGKFFDGWRVFLESQTKPYEPPKPKTRRRRGGKQQ